MVRRESLLQAAGTPAPFCPSVRLLVSVVCFSCMCLLFSINIDTNCSMNPETWNYSHVYSHMGNFTNTDIKVCNNSATNLGHIGELMVQLPAGWLSWRYGGKKVFVTCIATASVVALLTPTAIVESMHFVMTCSFLLGMCQVIWKHLYSAKSSGSVGTLHAARSVINAVNVTQDPHAHYYPCSEFMDKVSSAYIVTGGLQHFKMEQIKSEPVPSYQETVGDPHKMKEYLMQHARAFVRIHVMPKLPVLPTYGPSTNIFDCRYCDKRYHRPKSLRKHEARVHHHPDPDFNPQDFKEMSHCKKQLSSAYEYTRLCLMLGLLRLNHNDAIHMGDGGRMLRLMKWFCLYYKASKCTKYAIGLFETQAQALVLLSQRQAHRLVWNRTVNHQGKPDTNHPNDLDLEHCNRAFKEGVHTYMGRYTEKTISRVSRSSLPVDELCKKYDKLAFSKQTRGRQGKVDFSDDILKLVHQFHQFGKLFSDEASNRYPEFQDLRDPMSLLDMADVQRWISENLKGASWPAALTLLATWSPPLELSRLAAVIFSGQWIGILVSVSTTTASSHTSHQYWPNIFYIEGAIGSALVLFTAFLVHDVPSSHHLISGLERDYISRARMNIQTGESKTLPLQRILTSLPVWAIFIAHISSIWGRYVIFSAMTTYLSQVLHINQSQDLLMVKLTHAGVVIVMLVTAVIADRLRHSCLSTTSTRKLFTVIGEFLPAICLMVGGFSQSSESTFPSVLFVLGGCLVGCSYGSGYIVNVVDIASDYVPVVFAISNTIAVSIRLLGPLAVSNIADDMDQSSWQIIFVITAIVGLFGGLFYMVFGSGQDQFLSHEHREHAHCANQHTAINRAPQVLL